METYRSRTVAAPTLGVFLGLGRRPIGCEEYDLSDAETSEGPSSIEESGEEE